MQSDQRKKMEEENQAMLQDRLESLKLEVEQEKAELRVSWLLQHLCSCIHCGGSIVKNHSRRDIQIGRVGKDGDRIDWPSSRTKHDVITSEYSLS